MINLIFARCLSNDNRIFLHDSVSPTATIIAVIHNNFNAINSQLLTLNNDTPLVCMDTAIVVDNFSGTVFLRRWQKLNEFYYI